MADNNLLPCPFCGKYPVIDTFDSGDSWVITCDPCKGYAFLDFTFCGKDKNKAIQIWNTRALPKKK